MIQTKIARTDVVFSRAAYMVLLCAVLWIFRCLRKFQEKSQKIHAPEGSMCQKWGQSAARGAPGALLARPHPWPRQEAAWEGPPPFVSLLRLLFIPVARKPQNRS